MAEISNDLIEQLTEELKSYKERFGVNTDALDKTIIVFEKAVKGGAKTFADLNLQMDKYDKKIKTGTMKIGELGSSLGYLNDQVKEMDDGFEKSQLIKRIKEYENAFAKQQGFDVLKKSMLSLSVNAIEAGMALSKGILTNATSGASGFKIAADVYTTQIDFVNKQTGAMADAAGAAGSALSGTKGRLAVFGGALQVGAQAVKFFSNTMSDAAKFSINLLSQEADKLVNSFNAASSAGVIMAGGMDDFAKSATDAGLTYDQFANVVKSNSMALAEAGVTAGEAAKRLGQVGKAIRDSGIDTKLLKLGFGFEEQAEIQARVMADMRRTNVAYDPNKVASATEAYAKNLRVIADITGEDAKKKMDEARREAEAYAFRPTLHEIAQRTGKDEQQLYSNVTARMAMMSKMEREAFMQSTIAGTTTNVTAHLTGVADGAQKAAAAFNATGDTTAKAMLDFNQRNKDTYQSQLVAMSSATMLNGAYGDLSSQLNEQSLNAQKFNTANIAKAESDAKTAAEASGSFTNTMVQVAREAQGLKMQIQGEIKDALGNFAQVVNDTIKHIRENLKEYGIGSGGIEPSVVQKYGRSALQYGGAALGGIAGAVGATATTAATGGLGVVAAPAEVALGLGTGYTLGDKLADMLGLQANTPKKADGGITNGTSIVGEDGPEAVIPLKNGAIPMNIDFSDLIHAMSAQSDLTRDLIQEVRDSKDIQERILNASY